ncbi:MAG: GNAT family N-acetyltransferase [Clostridia bacterium]|nr:GNAT family N-acetyltransferase [Clostridia bacterium]
MNFKGLILVIIDKYDEKYLTEAIAIWNEVVNDGQAFPQTEPLNIESGKEFFESQSYTGIAVDCGKAVGLYILHPNNIGRCGHICNASYAVKGSERGRGIGELLVKDCLTQAKKLGFGILQFNAVVATNKSALSLYKKLGFTQLGTIPKGFLKKDGTYEDIIPHYINL